MYTNTKCQPPGALIRFFLSEVTIRLAYETYKAYGTSVVLLMNVSRHSCLNQCMEGHLRRSSSTSESWKTRHMTFTVSVRLKTKPNRPTEQTNKKTLITYRNHGLGKFVKACTIMKYIRFTAYKHGLWLVGTLRRYIITCVRLWFVHASCFSETGRRDYEYLTLNYAFPPKNFGQKRNKSVISGTLCWYSVICNRSSFIAIYVLYI